MSETPRLPSVPVLYLRAVLFWLGWASSTVLLASCLVLMAWLPYRVRYPVAALWPRFNMWWLALTCDLNYRVIGREHIAEVSGSGIIMAKHQSTWETMALQRVFPRTSWVLKRELMWIPFFGWGLALTKPIAIRRSAGRQAVTQLVKQGQSRLDEGLWVVVFPEGTRVAPGQAGKYKIGGAVLATQSGYPVVPVAHNAGEFWPRHGFIKRPGTITVIIGEPIDPRGLTPEALTAQVRDWIEARMDEIALTPRKTRD